MIPPKHEQGVRVEVAEGEKSHKQRLLDGERTCAGGCIVAPPPPLGRGRQPPHGALPLLVMLPASRIFFPAGEPYNAEDPELVDDRIRCRRLLHKLNVTLGAPARSHRAAAAAATVSHLTLPCPLSLPCCCPPCRLRRHGGAQGGAARAAGVV